MNETSKRIVFHGDPANYNKWANEMFRRGFNFPVSQVMKTLNVSLSWVNHTLLHEIMYVTYSAKFVYQKGITSRERTYIDYADLVQWLQQVGQFRRQTELVDLYSYLYIANRKKADEALKMYRKIIKESNIGYNPGIIPEAVLQYINKNYFVNFEPKNLSCIKRTEVGFLDVESFNFLECDYYFPDERSPELTYRDAFMKGDTKITIGNKKTIFVRNGVRTDKMKMPFLIPFNKRIIVYNKG